MKEEIQQYLILALILVFLIILVFTIVIFVRNVNLIKSDPLIYGMKRHNFIDCSCFDSSGNYYVSSGEGFIFIDKRIGGE